MKAAYGQLPGRRTSQYLLFWFHTCWSFCFYQCPPKGSHPDWFQLSEYFSFTDSKV